MAARTAERLLWTLAVTGWAMALLGVVGPYLGWWNDAGQLLTSWGTLLGIVMTASSIAVNAERDHFDAVHAGVETTHEKLDRIDSKLDELDELDVIQAELDRQTGAMDRQLRLLEQIRDGT